MTRRRYRKKEESLAMAVARYLQLQYPNIEYRFDASADMRLTKGQAVKLSKLQGGQRGRGYPDLFIAKCVAGYGGLYLELKKDKNEVYKKNGELREDAHNKVQQAKHQKLRDAGYLVTYGFGLDDSIQKIRMYLNGKGKDIEQD